MRSRVGIGLAYPTRRAPETERETKPMPDWRQIESALINLAIHTGIELLEERGDHFIHVAAEEGDEDLEIRLSDVAKELAERLK